MRNTDKIIEDINLESFLINLRHLIGDNGIIISPKAIQDLVQMVRGKNNEIIGIKINKTRVYLQEPYDETVKYFVDCMESISFDHMKKVTKHDKFTFYFKTQNTEDALKDFRIDYNPGQEPVLHAHDYNYDITNKNHLEYPGNIKLLLPGIDINTMLSILNRYINNTDEYPLNNNYSNKYNGIIKLTRRSYDGKI